MSNFRTTSSTNSSTFNLPCEHAQSFTDANKGSGGSRGTPVKPAAANLPAGVP